MTKKAQAGAPRAAGTLPAPAAPQGISIDLYDDITRWSVRDIVSTLRANPNADVLIHVNCPGGDVLEGFALSNVLRAHQGRKVAIVEGACSSAATFVACACDEVRMFPESFFMTHAPSADSYGVADDLEQHADLLRKMSGLMVAMYQRKTNKDLETVTAWLSADTWMTPVEALAAGLCDVILDARPTASARARTARYVALLKRGAKTTTSPRSKRTTMEDNETLPPDIAAKLADYGLGDDQSPASVKAALMRYLAETDDGPEDRKAVIDACQALLGDAAAKAEDEDEPEAQDDEGEKKAKAKASASADPATAKLVDSLTGQVAKLTKQVASHEAQAKKAKETEFYAAALQHTSREDAKEYLALCGGDHGKALKLVQKLPKKNGALGKWYAGGSPIGGGSAKGSAEPVEAHKQVRVGGRAMYLGGYGFAAQAKKIAAERKIPLGQAQIALAKERPDLLADEA